MCANILNEPYQNAMMRTYVSAILYAIFDRTVAPLKSMFSKKATPFENIFTVDLTLCSKCQIDSEDFVKFL